MLAKIQFHIDQLLSRGANSLIIWLAGISLFFVLISSYVTWILQIGPHESFGALFWDFMMRAITPWEIEASMGSYPYLLMMLAITLFGIFVLSILISLLSAIIDARVRDITNGVKPFPYSGHVVIMGYSRRLIPIIEELIKANESKKLERIVIISALSGEELNQTVMSAFSDFKTTKIFIRSRDLTSESSYDNVNLLNAKKILILGDDGPHIEADRLKIFLSLQRYLQQHLNTDRSGPDVLVNVDEPSAAEMISMASERPAVCIDVSNIPARLIVETVEQPHLPEIYEELLSFDGNEIYISDSLKQMGLNDMSFASAWRSFKDSVAVGILRANNQLELAPSAGTPISAEDRLVMVAEDDSTIRPSITEDGPEKQGGSNKASQVIKQIISKRKTAKASSKDLENILLIGLSEEHEYLVNQIIENLPKLKQLQLFLPDNAQGHEMAGKIRAKKSRKIKLANGITDDKNALQDLKCAQFDAIIISHTASYEIGKEDIESIRAIIILREFLDHQPNAPHLIAEMRVGKNKDITSAAANSDFVVSEKIGSKVFAQFIENPHLQTVIDNLICSSNHHIRLIETPASTELKQLRFGEIGAELLEHQRILIGWSYAVGDGDVEPFINPGMYALLPENCTKLSLVVIEKSGTR